LQGVPALYFKNSFVFSSQRTKIEIHSTQEAENFKKIDPFAMITTPGMPAEKHLRVQKVEHKYHDYSREIELDQKAEEQEQTTNRNGEQNFPVKLHFMLSELAADGLDHIVSWQPHGRCFVVHKHHEFVKFVLPL